MTSGYIGLKELIIIFGELKSMHIIAKKLRWLLMVDLISKKGLIRCLRGQRGRIEILAICLLGLEGLGRMVL